MILRRAIVRHEASDGRVVVSSVDSCMTESWEENELEVDARVLVLVLISCLMWTSNTCVPELVAFLFFQPHPFTSATSLPHSLAPTIIQSNFVPSSG